MRLSRELHDEFGQRLTAIPRRRGLAGAAPQDLPDVQPVVQGMLEQCAAVQGDVRGLLARLQPLAGVEPGEGAVSVATLAELLQGLAEGWRRQCQRRAARRARHRGRAQRSMPRELALALYRISQEALTNVARHAGASVVTDHAALARGQRGDSVVGGRRRCGPRRCANRAAPRQRAGGHQGARVGVRW